MRLLRQYRFVWTFLAVLVFSSVMVVRQFSANQAEHNEIREAFILLHTRGYTNQAQRLYYRLLMDLDRQPNHVLYDDFRRTMTVVDPSTSQPRNLIWRYHWTVSNELERRSDKTISRALQLADEEDRQGLSRGQQ